MLFCLAGNLQAQKDIWILGDSFLRDTFRTLQALGESRKERNDRKDKRTENIPYIISQYNVVPLMLNFSAFSLLARLINNMIEGLNATNRMPRILLVILDQAIVREINFFEYGISKVLAKVLTHLIKQIQKAIERRKDIMCEIKPGSLNRGEPKIIYLAMFDCPNPGKYISLHAKFNAILEEILAGQRNRYFLNITDSMGRNCFDRYNNITSTGQINMWMEIDFQLN